MATSIRNVTMFGVEDIEALYEDMKSSITYRVSGANMLVMSLLSDAQEEMVEGNTERSRQIINVAKYVLSEEMQKERVV